ncbi:MAG TPA: hypothetical protein DDW65_12475 [Firmicutes bacterium]|jgi:hypothetical protein|nr:hypothetical protein [Bacillota bacterium]
MESIPEEVLRELVMGKVKVDLDFIALKIMLSRLQQRVKMTPDSNNLQPSVKELQIFLAKFGYLPNVQKDVEKILKNGGYHE